MNISAIISTLALSEGVDNLEEGNFVCMRRSNDISQVKDFSPAPQVGSHKDGKFGTHHARDAYHLFKTKGIELQLFSSAVKLPTQYMHTLWFDLRLKRPTHLEKIMTHIKANDRIAITEKKDANAIFSFGRDHGYFGRIMNQTVIPTATLTMPHDRRLVGMCFTPQDANSLLSSLAAAVRYHHPQTWETKLQVLQPLFFDEV
jgi:glyceraldehyde-3-phosphate dehydrogenase (NAD(P))